MKVSKKERKPFVQREVIPAVKKAIDKFNNPTTTTKSAPEKGGPSRVQRSRKKY